ncbi:hypothetical protein SDC9_13856 [bioreactor metagenome]|uniref:Glycosyl transferase family 1 domain-containing protein n=1 Tax=bioreactor metagenome TaxID=1076179 RepID=A0A644TMH8_9ZZZZ
MNKKKVLWLSDFNCATGLATVAHNIMEQLLGSALYDFHVIGINHLGEPYDFRKWPFPIYPAINLAKARSDQRYADVFGRQRFLDFLNTGYFDIVFTLLDTFLLEPIADKIIEARERLGFQWIFYYPVDGQVRDSWINNSALLADYPVCYTNFGRRETLRVNPAASPRVIYHGVNIKDFFPIEDISVFRRSYFKENADKFIITNVNRNQLRKDIPRTITAFAKFKQYRPDSLLYLHMQPIDLGGNILEMASHWGLKKDIDFMVPDNFDVFRGYSIAKVNQIYNASDVVITTTLGEGWGLTTTEAMATKTPVIIPDNTALSEIGADGRARLVRSSKELICYGASDGNNYRPLTDVDDLVAALVDCYDNRDKYAAMAEKAFNWVVNLSWDNIGCYWREIFACAAKAAETRRTQKISAQ